MYVIEQIASSLTTAGVRSEPYFFRTSDGRELDLALDTGRERWAFEMKLTSQPDSRDLDRLQEVAELVATGRRFLISQTRDSTFSEGVSSANLQARYDSW